eukprot:6201584-Pleurochrysis_carterae.AAC.1
MNPYGGVSPPKQCLYQALPATAAPGFVGRRQMRRELRGLGRQANCSCPRRCAGQRGESARPPRAGLFR